MPRDCVMRRRMGWSSWTVLTVLLAVARATELEYDLVEGTDSNTEIMDLISAADLATVYGEDVDNLQFSFLPQSSAFERYFNIGPSDGAITTEEVIDRDTVCEGQLVCDMVLHVGVLTPDFNVDTIVVTIHIEDLNDNPPQFIPNVYDITLSETAALGTELSLPSAVDPDSGPRGVQSYSLREPSTTFGLNVIDNGDGTKDVRLILNELLNREEVAYYSLFVVARDGGSSPLSGTLTVSVTVLDANDNNPVFTNSSYSAHVPEDISLNTPIVTVHASDPDEGINGDIIYQWDTQTANSYGDIFDINNISGMISLKSALDYETRTSYTLTVVASDRGASGVPSRVKVIITVGDVNDFPPIISVDAPFTSSGRIEVPENTEPESYVGHVTVQDGDSGPSGQVTCILTGGPFRLNLASQNIYTLVSTERLDRELQPQYTVTVQCTDMGSPPITSIEDVVVTVLDKNDHAPTFLGVPYTIALPENVTVGSPITRINATDLDSGDNARLTFALVGAYSYMFLIDPDTAVVTAERPLDYETMPVIEVTVIVSDNGPSSNSVNTTLTMNLMDVNDEKPEFADAAYEFGTFENQSIGTEIGVVRASDADASPFDVIVYRIEGSTDILDTFEIGPTSGRLSIRRSLDREYRAEYVFVVSASNPGYPANINNVYVSVLVADVNDNAPQMIFPVPGNNTVHVPHLAPVGYFFARVSAVDADMGLNSRLTYTFARPVEDNVFQIDTYTGSLSVADDLSNVLVSQYTLLVMVKDSGSPPHSSVAELTVIVNRTMIAIVPESLDSTAGGITLNQSQTILISLAMVTVLLVTVLVVAIILVKRRQAKQEEAMLRSQACSIIPDLSSSSDSTSRSTKESSTLNDLNQSLHDSYDVQPQKDLSYEVNKGLNNGSLYSGQLPPRYDYPNSTMVKLQNNIPTETSSRPTSPVHYKPVASGPVPGPANQVPRHRLNASPAEMLAEPWKLTQKELAVHRLVQHMSEVNAEDSDSTSGCSADVSNTDSGRGPSEDGDRTSPTPHAEHRPTSPHKVGHPMARPQKRKLAAANESTQPRRDSSDYGRAGPLQGSSGLAVKPGLEAKHGFSNNKKLNNSPSNHPEYLQLRTMPLHNAPTGRAASPHLAGAPYLPVHRPAPKPPKRCHSKQPCINNKPSFPRPPRNVSFADPQKGYGSLPRVPDYLGSMDRASSVLSTVDGSDSGSTTSGSYTIGDDDQLGHRFEGAGVQLGHTGHAGSFV